MDNIKHYLRITFTICAMHKRLANPVVVIPAKDRLQLLTTQ